MTLTPTDFHPATDALVAFVDGELSASAHARAAAHVARCHQCTTDVAAQLEAKAALIDAAVPGVPLDLLSRLRALPFTADLPESDLYGPGPTTLSSGNGGPPGQATFFRPSDGFFLRSVTTPDNRGPGATAPRRPRDARPRTRATQAIPRTPSWRLRRFRRGLVGVMAGFAVGVLATAVAPVASTPGVGASQTRQAGRVGPGSGVSDAVSTRNISTQRMLPPTGSDDVVDTLVRSSVTAPFAVAARPTVSSLLAVTSGRN